MIRVKEVIIVEGRYDKNTLSQAVEATIIETTGFGIYSKKELLSLIRRLALDPGIVVLADSDGAGFQIRGYLKGSITKGTVKHAYIPDIPGREKRKRRDSAEGKLGVEGMRREQLIKALQEAGATMSDCQVYNRQTITNADLYELGLTGGKGSADRRRAVLKHFDLPERLNAGAMLDVLNRITDLEGLKAIACRDFT